MTDIQKSLVSTSVAGTRQGNMFQTLMEGMSEDGGETFRKYLELAEESEGITDGKYEIAVTSIASALETLTSNFDRLVSSFESSGIATSVLDFVSDVLSGLSDLNENVPALGRSLTMLIPILATVAGLAVLIKSKGSTISLLAGIGVAGIGMFAASQIGKFTNVSTANNAEYKQKVAEQNSQYIAEVTKRQQRRKELIEETVALGKQYDELGSAMDSTSSEKFEKNLNTLITLFPELKDNISDATSVLSQWKTITDEAAVSVNNLTKEEIAHAEVKAKLDASTNFDDYVQQQLDQANADSIGISYDSLIGLANAQPIGRETNMYSFDHYRTLYEAGLLGSDTAQEQAIRDLFDYLYKGQEFTNATSEAIFSGYASNWFNWFGEPEIYTNGRYNELFARKYFEAEVVPTPKQARITKFNPFSSERNIADFLLSDSYDYSDSVIQ